MLSFSLIVPTRNAGVLWHDWLAAIKNQSMNPDYIVMVDSSSEDETVKVAESFGISTYSIDKHEFNHGGTRNYAVSLSVKCDVIVFLTQDALLSAPSALSSLLSVFNDPSVAAVCGRQFPHIDANPLATHARLFNYPEASQIKSIEDINTLGLKVAFMSNSFAAYRRDVFETLGGFPENTILAEDMYMASKMILAGYKVAYCAEAAVRHSHNYTPWEEFRRYFDIGVFHACEPWIQEELGGASGEGLRFVKSELSYLWCNAPLWIPRALLTTACKLVGYKLGKNYKKLPTSWRPKLSMYKSYWLQQSK
ncbi:glycosyltransferase [Aeromonas jandaei]|uniref:glycosyltransferase family 2 protein n=1 Tax=Aeromonas jandaei TaxID=650 RepID=UPI001932D53E|nr:glycosyltransferase [Aeromonas jandaei]MBM0491901.1 glycosyltransferase family 2 protein [Aeromonas jandaei]MBM0568715.1 glycosyltransferase [Aeromonas jandaei]